MTAPAPTLGLLAVSHTGLHSGAERVLGRALRAAAEAGWQVRCAVPQGPFADDLRAAGVATLPLPDLKLPGGPRPLAALLLLLRALRAARVLRRAAHDVDLVLVNGLLGLPAVGLARLRAPVAWLVHDVVTRRDWTLLLRAVRRVPDLALPVSEAAAAPLRVAGVPVQVVRNGTPWPIEPASHPAPEPPVVGCVGLLTPWKGQEVLLEAVAGLPAHVRLELAGGTFPKDADHVARLRTRAEQADLHGRVSFLGAVEDVPARVRGWSVAVSPSTAPDPAPLAVLEAMSLAVPVVATAHGGPPEYLAETGVLVPPGDADALREALAALLGSPERREALGRAARSRVEQHYRADARLAELLDVLQRVARSARVRAA